MQKPNNKKIILESVMLQLYLENNDNLIFVDEF